MKEVFGLLFSFSFLFSCLSINMFLQSPQPEDRLGFSLLNDPKCHDYPRVCHQKDRNPICSISTLFHAETSSQSDANLKKYRFILLPQAACTIYVISV